MTEARLTEAKRLDDLAMTLSVGAAIGAGHNTAEEAEALELMNLFAMYRQLWLVERQLRTLATLPLKDIAGRAEEALSKLTANRS